ncbi:hypothetical protein Tco_1127945, partial [Tanacetum coccineum]
SDLGLSKLGVTGLGMSDIVTNGCGTHGLCIIEPDNGFILSGESVKEYYNKGNVIKIIDPSLREQMGSYSMTKFSEIAYRCLHDDREQRPAMDIVAKELEETLNVHGHFRISLVVASDIMHQNICTSIQKQMAATSKATASNNRRSYVGDIGGHGIQIRRRYVSRTYTDRCQPSYQGEKYGHLQKAASILLSSADDPNRRTRSATLPFLRSFMYRNATGGPSIASIDGRVLALAACMFPLLQKQLQSSVGPMLNTWSIQKDLFTEEQLEVLANTSSSSSYFAINL